MKLIVLSLILFTSQGASSQGVVPPGKEQKEGSTDQMKQSVVFLETHWVDSTKIPPESKSSVGTGFLMFLLVPELGLDAHGDGRGIDFLVTAKHMIRQKRDDNQPGPYAKNMTVRFNTLKPVDETGKSWGTFDADILDSRGDLVWFTDDSDSIADVALTPIVLGGEVEYKTIPTSSFVTKEVITSLHVNENDEVLFAGLFTGYLGAQKNYPIVRHGKLALLPGEEVALDPAEPNKKSIIYLAEIASFGGNSGSPVFLRIGPLREGLDVNLKLGYQYYLLGVMKGFVSDLEAKQNSGIALVIPAEKIGEILAGSRVRAYIARGIAHDRAEKGDLTIAEEKFKESISLLDSVEPEGSQMVATLEDYAAMLEKARRTNDARTILAKAQKIMDRPVSQSPQP